MSWGGIIVKRDSKSKIVDIGTPEEIRKLISEGFPGVKWNRESFADKSAEFGTYDSGDGAVIFGIFCRNGKMVKGLDLEIRGLLADIDFESVCEFCGRKGWEICEDDTFEREVIEGEYQDGSGSDLRAFYEVEERKALLPATA